MEIPSVWKEEINKALIAYTKSAIQIVRNGSPYDLPIYIRQPDENLKIEKYPCVTWYNTMDLHDTYRTDITRQTYYNPETNKATQYYKATSYSIYYQLDFWAKLWGDIDLMTRAWIRSLPAFGNGKFFNLPVTDSLGNETTVFCAEKDILRRRDTYTDGQKQCHSTIVYAISGYLGREYEETEAVHAFDLETDAIN